MLRKTALKPTSQCMRSSLLRDALADFLAFFIQRGHLFLSSASHVDSALGLGVSSAEAGLHLLSLLRSLSLGRGEMLGKESQAVAPNSERRQDALKLTGSCRLI